MTQPSQDHGLGWQVPPFENRLAATEDESCRFMSAGRRSVTQLLHELAHALRDSQSTLIETSAKVADAQVVRLLYRMAGERAFLADELGRELGGENRSRGQGTLLTELRRILHQIATTFAGDDPGRLLTDVEQVDHLILQRYREVLQQPLEEPLRRLIEAQLAQVQSRHETLLELKQQLRGS